MRMLVGVNLLERETVVNISRNENKTVTEIK